MSSTEPSSDCARTPSELLTACAAANGPVDGFYWDAIVPPRAGARRIAWGLGGLDELVADQVDLSACCALSEDVVRRLEARGAISSRSNLAQAISLIARDTAIRLAHCENLTGALGPIRPSSLERPAATAEFVSVVVPLVLGNLGIDQIVEAVLAQALHDRFEIVLVGALDAAIQERIKAKRDLLGARKVRIRTFSVPGNAGPAYLVDVGVALAAGSVVVVADPRCGFKSPTSLQRLADWAAGGDVLTACPAMELNQNATLFGLSATQGADAQLVGSTARLDLLNLGLTAAPTPWMFALNRAAWMTQGGTRGGGIGPLWTASLAYKGSVGRNILVMTETVTLADANLKPSDLRAPIMDDLSRPANRAIRMAIQAEPSPKAKSASRRARAMPATETSNEAELRKIEIVQPADAPRSDPDHAQAAVSDQFPSTSRHRILVFADRFAASQSLLFEQGLKAARERGEVSIRIVEEPDGVAGEALDRFVRRHVEQVSPTLVFLSRLTSMDLIQAAKRAAAETSSILVAHFDDDLLDLPASVGIERYRRARSPARMDAIHAALQGADLVLASTPRLAKRLGSHSRTKPVALRFGTAGVSSSIRAARTGPLTIGYMGSASHDADFAMIVPALNAVRRARPDVRFELFGSIAEQPSTRLLQGEVASAGPMIKDYQAFKSKLASLDWDIGLAPLRPIAFNRVKTPTKWVEYAEAGIVAVVSNLEPYWPAIDAGAAFAADADEWETVLGQLLDEPERLGPARGAADRLLTDAFSWSMLEGELLAAFERVGHEVSL